MRNNSYFQNLNTFNLNDNAEKEITIKDFGGVDLSNSTLFVDKSRAVKISNFIKENGINQKRKGFKELAEVPNKEKIRGAWVSDISFTAYGESKTWTKTLIVLAGNIFYKYNTESNNFEIIYSRTKDLSYSNYLTKNKNCSAFSYNGVLYVLTGEKYLMIGDFGVNANDKSLYVEMVEDSYYTYIPTTTVNIPPENYNALLENQQYILKPSSYEEVNMMSSYRKNKLLGLDLETLKVHYINYQKKIEGLVKKSDNNYYNSSGEKVELDPYKYLGSIKVNMSDPDVFEYILDGIPFDINSYSSDSESYNVTEELLNCLEIRINGIVYMPEEIITSPLYTNEATGNSYNKFHDDVKKLTRLYGTPLAYRQFNNESLIAHTDPFSNRADTASDLFCTNDTGTYKVPRLMFYIYLSEVKMKNGVAYGKCHIIFNYNVVPIDNVNPITITYKRNVGLAEKINKCNIGCMFGHSQDNRLFVSGNEDYPNMDWHTIDRYDLDSYNNKNTYPLTYFGEMTYSQIGNSSNAINGYSILGDGKLAIFKTGDGMGRNIYIRQSSTFEENITDSNGNDYVKITEIYPIQIGTIGVSSIGFNTIHNLNGDIMLLSKNGIYGVELGTNVASSQHWAKNRSTFINPILQKYDLSKAVCIVYDNRFYISLEDGKTFIADSRYKTSVKGDIQNNYQYEWWEWNSIKATTFFVYEDKLWFGTNHGKLCCFENKDYIDLTFEELSSADISLDNSADHLYKDFVINKELDEVLTLNDVTQIYDDVYALGIDTALENINIVEYKNYLAVSINLSNLDKDYVDFINSIPSYPILLETTPNIKCSFIDVVNDYENNMVYLVFDETVISQKNILLNKGYKILLSLKDKTFKIKDIKCKYNDTFYLLKDYRECNGRFVFVDKDNIEIIELDTKPVFNYFSIAGVKTNYTLQLCDKDQITPIVNHVRLIRNKVVECIYVTPPLDMGTRYYNKDLRKLIIVPDNMNGTEVEFGFKTSTYQNDYSLVLGKGLDFDDVDFDNINFGDNNFAKVYVKQSRVKRWSYIQFYFRSKTNNNCKINNLTIIYTLGTKNKGVK